MSKALTIDELDAQIMKKAADRARRGLMVPLGPLEPGRILLAWRTRVDKQERECFATFKTEKEARHFYEYMQRKSSGVYGAAITHIIDCFTKPNYKNVTNPNEGETT